jgi:hypothetical protein
MGKLTLCRISLHLVKTVVAEGSFLPIKGAGATGRGPFSVFSSDFSRFWR